MNKTEIKIQKSQNKKAKPIANQLGFGKAFSDHMFVMDYEEDRGWYQPRIVPYEPITLDPAAMVFHFGQTVFEGFKAYRTNDNRVLLFRPEKNLQRMNHSNNRMCIPSIDEEFILDAIKLLVQIDQDWVPSDEGTALYVRPFVIATESTFTVKPSNTYKFMIILSPVASYYSEGINPVRINVEDEYIRAAKGGTGEAKTAGNYSASYKAQEKASSQGFAQILWLDSVEKKYIEEVGAMNVFFKINGEVVTPALNGSILSGITRMSVIEMLKKWEIPISERRISIEEIYQSYIDGHLEEVFGTGTAVVISPVGELNWKERKMIINDGQQGELSKKLYDTLTGIQTGKIPDPDKWTVEVK